MYDLLINNGKTVHNQPIYLAVQGGKIVEIKNEKIVGVAKESIDLAGEYYISAGWIDDHVHCYEKMSLYYDHPDEVGVKQGIATVIDAGTTGANNIGDFYENAKRAKTNVYALLNISEWGIVAQDELADLQKINPQRIQAALQKYPDFIVGLKARMSKTVVGANGILPLELAKHIQKENQPLTLMVHIGSAPPYLVDVLNLLEKGDVLTHCFNGKDNGIVDRQTNRIKDFVWEAYHRGVIFDIGHGTDSFNFQVAELAKGEGLQCCSISTDIYHRNRENGPVYNLATTMEKLLVIGYTLEEVIDKVTRAPAANFKLENKGELAVGYDADFTIFEIFQAEKELTDSNGQTRITKKQIVPTKTIIGGTIYDIE